MTTIISSKPKRPSYPYDKYHNFMVEFNVIKNANLSNFDKWDQKYELIRLFINETHVLPAGGMYNYIGYPDKIKNEETKQYRLNKISQLFCCNFVKGGNEVCNVNNTLSHNYKEDPFKCYNHSKRCPNCATWVDSQGPNKKYDNYCARCFKQLFQNDERSKVARTHEKELIVRNFINNNFEGFIHDTPLYTGNCKCTHRRRIDHRKLINETLLCIETDEFAHVSYNKKDEEIRYDDLYMIYSGKWIFIRFNPDKKGTDIHSKLEELRREIIKNITRINENVNSELVEIHTLFY